MQIFVSGGTGLLGNTLLRQLSEAGHSTIALARGEPNEQVFDGIATQIVIGDLCDAEVIDSAVRQSDAVIHSAALIHLGWYRLEESLRVNRDGTRMIVDACIKHGRKLVHVGTVDTLAIGTKSGAADEQTPLDWAGGQIPCSYVVSKRAGVAEVLQGVQRGLRAAIVHPGFMLGPWDWKPSSGRMVQEVGRVWRPVAPSGGCSLCDSRDVATGTIAALEKGGDDGRQFILAGVNWDYKKLWSEMAVRMGRRAPIMRSNPLLNTIAGLAGDGWSKLVGRECDANSAGVMMSEIFHWHDSSRARRELGYQTRDAGETLDASAEWIRKHHPT